jgi:hypothetical protein
MSNPSSPTARIRSALTRQRVARVNRGTRIAAATIALAATALTAGAATSQATVTPVRPPARVILSGPTTQVTIPVISTARIGGSRVHVISILGGGVALDAGLVEDTPTEVRHGVVVGEVTGRVPAAGFTPGRQTWQAMDVGDGRVTRVPVLVLRAARLSPTTAVVAAPGWVRLSGGSSSYNPARGAYGPSVGVPVQVQQRTPSGWVTRSTVTTDSRGAWCAWVQGGAGTTWRATRVEAAISTGATSTAAAAR